MPNPIKDHIIMKKDGAHGYQLQITKKSICNNND